MAFHKKNHNSTIPLYLAVFHVLKDVFEHGRHADKGLEFVFKSNKYWGSRERGFVARASYDILRYWRLLVTTSGISNELTEPNFWRLLAAWMIFRDRRVPEIKQFEGVNAETITEKLRKYSKVRKLRESVPDWLDELGEKELGHEWDAVIAALNMQPLQVLRVNTIKASVKELQALLEEESVHTSTLSWANHALTLDTTSNPFRTKAFKEGLFETQDAASQKVAESLQVQPGMRVIDACAGAGGKSLHLAALMMNKGRILSLDTDERKLEELKRRARRAGAEIIETRVIDTTKVIKRLHNTADRLLLDVPCSGLGVLRRNPDAKWHLQPEYIDRIKQQQQDILTRYSPMLRVGGLMTYATCSILPSEGEAQVRWFINAQEGKWKLVLESRLQPHVHNSDGFYMALLERAS